MRDLFIARDKDGTLFVYNCYPIKDKKLQIFKINESSEDNDDDGIMIDSELFPEITWENSPKPVKIELLK